MARHYNVRQINVIKQAIKESRAYGDQYDFQLNAVLEKDVVERLVATVDFLVHCLESPPYKGPCKETRYCTETLGHRGVHKFNVDLARREDQERADDRLQGHDPMLPSMARYVREGLGP